MLFNKVIVSFVSIKVLTLVERNDNAYKNIMEKLKVTNEQLLKDSLASSLTYSEYLKHIEEELASSPETEEELAMHNYTKLNATRIKRLDATQQVPEEVQEKIQAISQELEWVVLTEGWCGDAAQLVPILNKLQELNSNISMKLLLRDSNLELMDRYLTNGGRSIPKLLVYDPKQDKVLGTWGPRPAGATKLMSDYKEAHGVIDDEVKKQLQQWYNKDKGNGTMQDILKLHESFKSL